VNNVKYIDANKWTVKVEISWEINDYETLIVKNWNVIISWDLNTTNNKLWIIVLNEDLSNKTLWNVYIKPNVNYINAIIYADGSVISADSSWNPFMTDSSDRTLALQKQLVLRWTLFTRNTIGWAVAAWDKTDSWENEYRKPWWATTPLFSEAMIYDLNYLRRWNEWWDTPDSINEKTNWWSSDPFVVIFDDKIQTDSPKWFKN
jgi:hypothetical protein